MGFWMLFCIIEKHIWLVCLKDKMHTAEWSFGSLPFCTLTWRHIASLHAFPLDVRLGDRTRHGQFAPNILLSPFSLTCVHGYRNFFGLPTVWPARFGWIFRAAGKHDFLLDVRLGDRTRQGQVAPNLLLSPFSLTRVYGYCKFFLVAYLVICLVRLDLESSHVFFQISDDIAMSMIFRCMQKQ